MEADSLELDHSTLGSQGLVDLSGSHMPYLVIYRFICPVVVAAVGQFSDWENSTE